MLTKPARRVRIDVGGTGEKPPSGFLGGGLGFRNEEQIGLLYKASIGPMNLTPNPIDFVAGSASSRADGVLKLKEKVLELNAEGVRPGIAGYSLGAWVVSDFAHLMLVDPVFKALKVRYFCAVANPLRLFNPIAPHMGYGVAGQRKESPHNIPFMEIANETDGIPCCPANSALRTLPFLGEVLTANLDQPTRAAWNALAIAAITDWRKLKFPTGQDLQMLGRYLDGSAHGREYFDKNLFAQAHMLP